VLLEEFEDFREELFFIAKEREKENIKNIKTVSEGGVVPEQNSSHMEVQDYLNY